MKVDFHPQRKYIFIASHKGERKFLWFFCTLNTGSVFPEIDTGKMQIHILVLKTCSWALAFYNFLIQYNKVSC